MNNINIYVTVTDENNSTSIEFTISKLTYDLNALIPLLEAGHIIEMWLGDE